MVAYSFKERFVAAIEGGVKRQTIRAIGKKLHARPGEAMQLYTKMRTKQCRKLIEDPVCDSVDPIEIVTSRMIDGVIASISINGIPLDAREIEDFARMDGFTALFAGGQLVSTARQDMGGFWLRTHGEGRFEGVLIRWRP